MLKLLLGGVSIETMVEGYILQGFHEGRFSPDVGLLIKAPLSVVMAGMAEAENIPYRMFENRDAEEEGKMSDESFFKMIKTNNPRMFEFIKENINESIREGDRPLEENFLNMQPTVTEERIMSFGLGLVKGLVGGFTRNIQQEQQARATDDQRLFALEDTLFAAAS